MASEGGTTLYMTIDGRYLPALKLFLRSLQRFHGDRLPVHLFTINLEWDALESVKFYRNLHRVEIDLNITEGPNMLGAEEDLPGLVHYSRFAAWHPEFLPAYERILFVDADILVCGKLDWLLEQNQFLAFAESYTGGQRLFIDDDSPAVQALLEDDEIRLSAEVANGGVLLIPRSCRTLEHFNELGRLTSRYSEHLPWADQTVTNLWMAKNGISVSSRTDFNFQFRRLVGTSLQLESAKLLHFNGIPYDVRLVLMQVGYRSMCIPGLSRRSAGILRWVNQNYNSLHKYIHWRQSFAKLFRFLRRFGKQLFGQK